MRCCKRAGDCETGRNENVQNETSAGTGLLTDKLTLETIRNYFADENKPSGLGPVDHLLMVYLMSRKAEDGGITDSQQTLARRFGCSVRTVSRSLELLQQSKYASRIRRKGRTAELILNVENIPAEAPLRLRLTEEATHLAAWYKIELKKKHRKKFPKRFTEQNTATAQRILNDCGGDVDLAKRILEFALGPCMYQRAARNSLYKLFERWPKVKNSYRAYNPGSPPIPEPQAVPTMPDLTVQSLSKSVAAQFNVGSTDQAAWQATLQRLSDAGNSVVHLQAVITFALTAMGEDTVKGEGAAGFEKHFAAISEAMHQSKEAA